MKIIKQGREKTFPDIKDFSDPQNHLRHKHPKDMPIMEWFWFHPTAFSIIYIGMPFIMVMNCFFFALVFNYYKNFIGQLVMLCIGTYFVFYGINKAQIVKRSKDMNFYDMFVRDKTE